MKSDNQRVEQRLTAHPFLKNLGMGWDGPHQSVSGIIRADSVRKKDQLIFKAGDEPTVLFD
jgi:hypothetical protein